MGNVISYDKQMEEHHKNQILLIGYKNQGKTRFLYQNLLQQKMEIKIKETDGYNYEVVNYEQSTYGIWDLGGNGEFREVWQVFYKYIPFMATIFMVRYFANMKDNLKNLSKSRKLLHFIVNNPNFQNKPFFLLVNLPNKDLFLDTNNKVMNEDEKVKQRNEMTEEIKKMLSWDQIDIPEKKVLQMDLDQSQFEYENLWKSFEELYKGWRKNVP